MKTFLLSLLLPMFLFASTTDIDSNYKEALTAYKANDFRTSYTLLKKIYLDKLADVNFNFYLGRSAYETGHYETALAAFERVSMQDSTNIRNKLEMARTYFMLKMYEDSQNLYSDVLSNPNIPSNIRRNIELSLSRVSKVQKKSFTYATIKAEILYDSNINYGNIGSFEFNGSLTSPTERISDTALQLFANVTNVYDIGYKNGFALKNSFSLFSKNYRDNKNFNITYLSYNPSLIYKVTHYTVELIGGINTMQLGGKKYLSSLSIMPRFEYSHTPNVRSIVALKYQHKKFTQTAFTDLDANRVALSYALQDILTPRSYIQGKVYAINEEHVRGSNLYVDFNEAKFNMNYANQFSPRFALDIFAELRDRRYKDFSSGFGSTREDVGGSASIGITVEIIPKLRTRLGGSYEYINSNQDQFTYKKQTLSASIIKTF